MSVLFTDSMTVYNCHRKEETEEVSWSSTLVKGVQWSHNKTEVTMSDKVRTEGKVERITVDFSRSYGNKPYLPPQEYRKLPDEEREQFWTLDPRTGQDMIVLGEVDREISSKYRLSDLQEDYPYAVIVSGVSDNRNRPRLKNIKVTAK